MATRLVVFAHGATERMPDLVLGDQSDFIDAAYLVPYGRRVQQWWCGPEPACRQTAAALGGMPDVDVQLAGPRFGAWAGRTLTEVPEAIDWLRDAHLRPPDGESLAELVERVGRWCDRSRGHGLTAVVVTSLTARAMTVHALRADPAAIFRIDVPPLHRVEITGGPGDWRLRL